MQNAITIARREFQTYFNSPVAYIVLGVYLIAICSLFFFILGGGVFVAGRASMRAFFSISPWLFMVVAPAVTMRLVAEERKSGTLEILMTLPLNDWEVVLGKFLGAMWMICVGLLFTLFVPLSLSSLTAENFTFDWGPVIGGYLGLVLMASTFVATGMWASALTRNQIVSFILGLAICFVLIIIDSISFFLPESIGAIVQYLSVSFHFQNISRGVIDSRDLVYYFTMTAIGLRLTIGALRAARQ